MPSNTVGAERARFGIVVIPKELTFKTDKPFVHTDRVRLLPSF
jgi:hypothetical protein